MKHDTLKQYVSLRTGLVSEKAELEARLAEINEALGESTAEAVKVTAAAPATPQSGKRRPGRPPGRRAAAAPSAAPAPARARAGGRRARNGESLRDVVVSVLKTHKSLSRQDLLKAVVGAGYKFSAKDPLNSLSTLVYTAKKVFKASDGKISLV